MTARPRLAMLRDFREEQWPSMNLVADQLFHALCEHHSSEFNLHDLCAPYRRRFERLPVKRGMMRNIDRLTNRMIGYPRFARGIAGDFDLFHVVDHSYAQLVHVLPAERTGVFCHDLDTFRCVLDPAAERRPKWFRAMTRRVLSGLEKAAVVFHTTDAIRGQILRCGLVEATKLVKAPLGVSQEFTSAQNDPSIEMPPTLLRGRTFILHVGSCIQRKRIDVLLDVFANLRRLMPELLLVKIGGEWTAEQVEQMARLGVRPAIVELMDNVTRRDIAACYRNAAVVLMPSEAEGFGLPVAEALACGAPVVASDIPVLREVGADAASYAPLADIAAWTASVEAILRDPSAAPSREKRLARAADFTWKNHANIIAEAYRRVLELPSRDT